LEQGRFGTHQKLAALIENWSLQIGHWQWNSASLTASWPSRLRFPSAGSIMVDPRRQPPAAVSRSQAPGNPFRKAPKMSKNRRLSAAHN
jgi:hypothetical protein